MQNSTKPISSIICFNGGSAGDLLLTLCLTQVNQDLAFSTETAGFINIKKQYFKNTSKQIFLKQISANDIDLTRVRPIENTHYFLDFYKNIADKIYFIDYPDHMQNKILSRYVEKKYQNDWSKFLTSAKESLPEFARTKVTVDNCMQLFAIQWKKNLIAWRDNPDIAPLAVEKFSSMESMIIMVEQIINQSIESKETFERIYKPWQEKNQNLFCN